MKLSPLKYLNISHVEYYGINYVTQLSLLYEDKKCRLF